VVQQAAALDGLRLDAFTFEQDCVFPAKVDVGRGEMIRALVRAVMVVLLNERRDLGLELAGQVVIPRGMRFFSI
jgi:hypothetical protein